MDRKGTGSPVLDRSQARNTLNSHIVLKIKLNENGHAKRFNTQVVAGGHCQKFERHCGEVYAPVVTFVICLRILNISFTMGWFVKQVDVMAAFLNGDIDRELYITWFEASSATVKL